jgi:hypothetical protein
LKRAPILYIQAHRAESPAHIIYLSSIYRGFFMKCFNNRISILVLLIASATIGSASCDDSGDSQAERDADVIVDAQSDADEDDVAENDADENDASSDVASKGDGASDADDDDAADASATCRTEDLLGSWAPGVQAFRDASADWGLDASGANGQRISVADIDGDGWADLSVRAAGTTVASGGDVFTREGRRRSWLLKNTGADGAQRSFIDVTQSSGLVASRSSDDVSVGRRVDLIIWGDVDNDGDLDAYTAYNKGAAGAADTAEIMLNRGDGTFELGPADSAARNAVQPDSPGGASFVDFDRDGNLDLWVTQYVAGGSPLQDQLFRGDGSGSFVEVTDAAGLTTAGWFYLAQINAAQAHTISWGATACDLNGDGVTELMSASYGRAPNHLWRGVEGPGGVTFVNESVASGYAYDDRRDWTDNESARCYCKLNPEAPDCAGVPDPQHIPCTASSNLRWNHGQDRELFRLGGNSGTTVCADVDNDGWLDLLTTEIVHWDVGSSSDPSELLYNLQDAAVRFERPGNQATGLTREHDQIAWNDGDITAAVFDFDNDGRKDVYIGSTDYAGTRGHLWHQKEDGTFERVSPVEGIDQKSSHGVGVADFDRDGDLDLAVGHSRSRCSTGDHCYPAEEAHVRIFENLVGQNNNWLQVKLIGAEGTNRAAIGARVTVQASDITQVLEVGGGHGHYGVQHSMVQHFGLGAACEASVTVRWPDENLSEQTFVLRAGQRYIWTQGQQPIAVED